MEYADKRGMGASVAARLSLRRFKNQKKAEYRKQLEDVLARRVTPGMREVERRRLKIDQVFAQEELDAIRRGEKLSEFDGLLALRRALYESEGDE